MIWKLGVAVIASGILASFTDWLFMGVLFHDAYHRYPEIWWPGLHVKAADSRAIAISSGLSFITMAAMIGLIDLAGVRSIEGALIVAVLAWAAGPLVMQVTNGFWIKTDPRITFAHSLGYLARFLLAGLAAGIALR
ncbi:MAG TPA: hypothetical protein VGK90_11970 [Rhizomicrobium sp.]|jgi:hypothetical protein